MQIDLSIIPSHHCNLRCWFCMYEGGPEKREVVDLKKVKNWLIGFPWKEVRWTGAYGGEISTDYILYKDALDCFPRYKPRFTITNGSWSRNFRSTLKFIAFAEEQSLHVKVSSTKEHKKSQDVPLLEKLHNEGFIEYKKNDDTDSRLLPMGRLDGICGQVCKKECLEWEGAYRVGIEPNGNIIFQSCRGVYPIISTLDEHWSAILVRLETIARLEVEFCEIWKRDKLKKEKPCNYDCHECGEGGGMKGG